MCVCVCEFLHFLLVNLLDLILLHLFLSRGGHWGTTDVFTSSFLHFSLFSAALSGLTISRPVHSLMLSSHLFFCLPCLLPPFTVPCKMETWWTGDMSIPLLFASLLNGEEVLMWSNCLLDLGTDFLIGNVIRCVVSCGCTSFSWLVFFYAALLWGSMIHKHTGRWLLLDTTRFWWPLDFASSLEDAEYKRYQVPFHLWFTVSVVFCFLHWLFYVGICA